MSLGYMGLCRKAAEDDEMAIYTYARENWNDDRSQSGDALLQDGVIVIYKRCLENPEIHTHIRRRPSGRKYTEVKRITHVPSLGEHLKSGGVVIERECKNAFRKPSYASVDYIAWQLLHRIFKAYQETGELPEKEQFLQ